MPSETAWDRRFTVLGALSALIAVAAGAFGAHGLKTRLEPEMLAVFETAARYQMYHSLALIAAGWVYSRQPGRMTVGAGWAFTGGIVLFSGSLYALALSGVKAFGAVTPIGGVFFMAGWLLLALAAGRGPTVRST